MLIIVRYKKMTHNKQNVNSELNHYSNNTTNPLLHSIPQPSSPISIRLTPDRYIKYFPIHYFSTDMIIQ